MRIAIVYDCLTPFSTGGGERVYRRMAELLVEAGHEVDYLTRDQWSPGAHPVESFAVIPVWRGEIYDAGGVRRTAAALAFARAVRRELRTRGARYDLVVASALPVLTLLAARLALPRRVPVVGDWLEVWGLRTWLRYAGVAGAAGWVLQACGAWSTRFHTVNSPFTAARLRRARGSLRPLVLELLDFADQRPRRHAAEPPYLLAIGRLIPDKRVAALPAALRLARQHRPELRLVVVGDGPERAAVEAAATAEGVRDAVDLVGFVSAERLDELRRGAAALVHPSQREGFGLVVAEASASGLPVVVVDGEDNAAVALVSPGVNGVIAPSVAPTDLSVAIGAVLDAGDALRATAQAWYARESRERTLARSVDGLLRLVARGG